MWQLLIVQLTAGTINNFNKDEIESHKTQSVQCNSKQSFDKSSFHLMIIIFILMTIN